MTHIKADIALGVKTEELPHLDREVAQFTEFCTVSQSVRAGIPLAKSAHTLEGPSSSSHHLLADSARVVSTKSEPGLRDA